MFMSSSLLRPSSLKELGEACITMEENSNLVYIPLPKEIKERV